MFENALIELNKVQAPSLLLEDYNYFINKAINQYINKIYNLYEINQQKSDDLRVLKSSAVLTPTLQNDYPPLEGTTPNIVSTSALFGAVYEVNLPDDYLHILNCIVEYDVTANYKCYDSGTKVHFGVKRLTSDMYSQIIHNYFIKPSYKNPYFYVQNVNVNNSYPVTGTVDTEQVDIPGNENIERVADNRYGNKSKVRLELRFGKDKIVFVPSLIYIDYLKSPQYIRDRKSVV